ncbi:MAG: IS21-like element helper ATPase IstB [Planctomycetes bacterium]|nr:IS21-like element helper ATPase IstB [Planctomycetota bacterium]
MTKSPADATLQDRARRLGLWGLLANWDSLIKQSWVREYLTTEEEERNRRSLERRIHSAKLGAFKSIADFDWDWPDAIDRDHLEEILQLGFLDEAANVVLLGPSGTGKTMISQNLGYQALLNGHTVLRVTTSEMLNDLAAQDSSTAMARRLRRYCAPRLLLLDEVGYLSYDGRYGDLLFEVISRRYEQKSTVLTTNRVFSQWTEVFETASCVSALVDRIVHKAEIVNIVGKSYREKEAHERAERRTSARQAKATKRRAP